MKHDTMPLPRTPSFRLDGRRALVTGASSGIGLGCAVALAEQGAQVTLSARSADRLAEAAAALRAGGFDAATLVLDVSDVAATAASVAAHGPFDILVNSAGLARHAGAAEVTPLDFDAVAGLNIRGAFFVTQAVARGLLAAGRPGSLINISSQMGHVGG
ncbi:MAG: SDR family NAD(P)-dependent oxidoreductase, partial [Microvirga sp.]